MYLVGRIPSNALCNIEFNENQQAILFSNNNSIERTFSYNTSGLVTAIEEQGVNKTFAYSTEGL
jgi:hypothetical protein